MQDGDQVEQNHEWGTATTVCSATQEQGANVRQFPTHAYNTHLLMVYPNRGAQC